MKLWQISVLEKIDGWDDFLCLCNIVVENKKQLLEMAKNGESRPVINKHPLGRPLCSYICYDSDFNEKIRKLAPHWFINKTVENKRRLIEMAKNGKPRPIARNNLGYALCEYTGKNKSKDIEFDHKIRELAPHWFIDTAAEKKQELIEMAKDGESRPVARKHLLGLPLSWYTTERSQSYDDEFTELIKHIRPDWFADTATENKCKLLEMAKNNKTRPRSGKDKLGAVLVSYTCKKNLSMYDAEFDHQIRELAPHWFKGYTVSENKKQLLRMAKNGERRPAEHKHPLASSLNNYILKDNSSYDIDFDKTIRKLAPQWFVNTTISKKKKLIEMAKKGDVRPKCKKHPLGTVIYNYTCKLSESYDPEFDKQIRLVAPHWFRRQAC
jgi:hypothetical protein